jgi:hypothetical protein
MRTGTNIITTMLVLICASAFSQSGSGYFGNYFFHQCRDTNQVYNYTLINNTNTNNDSNVLAIVTPHSVMAGVDEDFHFGIWYSRSDKKWSIYNENYSTDSIDLYNGFNVLVPNNNGTMIKHTATAANIDFNLSLIDNPATNGKPNALLFITHNWGVSGGVYNNHATGVYYSQAQGKWGVYTEDLTEFPVGATYNVFVVDEANANAFIHTSGTPSPSARYVSLLDYPVLQDYPEASLFVTHNLTPGGVTNNLYDTSTVGVAQKGLSWVITNRDRSQIDSGTTFNVLIANTLPTTGINNMKGDAAVQVYPNPANNLVTVAHAYNFTATAQLTNAMGQQVAMYNLQQGTTQLDISMLPQGIYQLAMYNGAERLTVKRLIKQ